jgi:hypothetical protein
MERVGSVSGDHRSSLEIELVGKNERALRWHLDLFGIAAPELDTQDEERLRRRRSLDDRPDRHTVADLALGYAAADGRDHAGRVDSKDVGQLNPQGILS